MAGEGAQAHAGTAEPFQFDQIDEAFGVIVDRERLDGEQGPAMVTDEALDCAKSFGYIPAIVRPPSTFAPMMVRAVGVGTEGRGEQSYPPWNSDIFRTPPPCTELLFFVSFPQSSRHYSKIAFRIGKAPVWKKDVIGRTRVRPSQGE